MWGCVRVSKLQQFLDGTLPINKKGTYLVEHATPVYCAEVTMRCIANNIKELSERPDEETAQEATARFKINSDYIRVLEYLMAQMQTEILPALERLDKLQHPEDAEGEG